MNKQKIKQFWDKHKGIIIGVATAVVLVPVTAVISITCFKAKDPIYMDGIMYGITEDLKDQFDKNLQEAMEESAREEA